jgi:predicted amidohydrolase
MGEILGSIEQNLTGSIRTIYDAAEQGADLILFPEVHLTDFFPQYPGQNVSSYGTLIDSDIVGAFRTACLKNHIAAVPNIYLKENDRFYDASIFIDRTGEICGIQKMVHVAQAKNFYEEDYYEPSDTGFLVFDTEFGKIGIVVCFDRHYPESIRTESLMGADLILIPTVNTKSEPLEMFEWEVRVQAFQNSVAIAMCNRVGTEGKIYMMNMGSVMNLRNQFVQTHPKFAAFFQNVLGQGIEEGSVIEITVTRPDGTTTTGNMRVQASDLEMLQELKNLRE